MGMLRNWVFHASRFINPRTDQLVVAAESEASVKVLKDLSGLFGVHWDVQFIGRSSENGEMNSSFGNRAFRDVTNHRPQQILEIPKKKCSVLYHDIDAAWTKPVFPV